MYTVNITCTNKWLPPPPVVYCKQFTCVKTKEKVGCVGSACHRYITEVHVCWRWIVRQPCPGHHMKTSRSALQLLHLHRYASIKFDPRSHPWISRSNMKELKGAQSLTRPVSLIPCHLPSPRRCQTDPDCSCRPRWTHTCETYRPYTPLKHKSNTNQSIHYKSLL